MKTVTNLLKSLLLSLMMTAAFFVNAQDEEEDDSPAISFSGSFDTYFRSTFNQKSQTPGTYFADGTGFSVGMANIIGTYEGEKVGAVVDLVVGPRGREAAFGGTWWGNQNIINQMYAYWNASDKVTFTIGQWNTFVGYELISPTGNFNYSCSYLFSWGPFNQSGVKANIALNDNWGLLLAFMNPTDVLESNMTGWNSKRKYTAGLQLSYSNDAGGVYLNARYGDNQAYNALNVDGSPYKSMWQVDLTGGYNLSDAFYLGFNGTKIDQDGAGYYGAALYPKVIISDAFSIGARAEYVKFTGGFAPAGGYNASTNLNYLTGILYNAAGTGSMDVKEVTLTANYSIGNLTFIPELRTDFVSNKVFTDGDGKATGQLSSFLIAAVYSF